MTPTNHDPSKVLLGTTQFSGKEVTCENADPATFKAGLAVRRASTGGLALDSGGFVGVSLGRSLSDTKKTAVVRTGERVPLALTDDSVAASITKGEVTFTAKAKGVAGNDITIAFVDDGAADPEIEVDELDIIIHGHEQVEAEAATTPALIKAAIEANAEANALISVSYDSPTDDDEPQAAFAEDNLEGGQDGFEYVVKGAPVEVSTAGLGVDSGDATGAVYVSDVLDGVDPITGLTQKVALVDMVGGL